MTNLYAPPRALLHCARNATMAGMRGRCAMARTGGVTRLHARSDVVQDSAATLTCAAETAGDFAYQCAHEQEERAFDLPFLRLALEIWREHPKAAPAVLAALEELLAEQIRHQEAHAP